MGLVNWEDAVSVNLDNLSMDTIYITGAGYYKRPFKGISRDSVLGWEEPVWGGDLTRSTGFELSNITDVDFGKVARVEVSYKFMNIDDYKALCEIAKQRVCYVIYFNRETATWEYGNNGYGQEMAFTGNELGKLFTYGYKFVGGLDIKIKLVATNRDKADIRNQYTVSYNANDGTGTVPASVTRTWSENLKVADGSSLTNTYGTFAYWNTFPDGSGKTFLVNQDITIYGNLTLYAQWDGNNYTITLNNSDATTTGSTSATVKYGSNQVSAITNPVRTNYVFNGWYSQASGGEKVIDSTGNLIAGTVYTDSAARWNTGSGITLYAQWVAIPMEDLTWSQIKTIVQNGEAANLWSVGDTKSIQIGNRTYNVRLADLTSGRYNYVNENRTTNAVFELVELLPNNYQMGYTTVGGWDESQLKTTLNSTILNMLPSDLRSILENVYVPSANGAKDEYTQIVNSSCKLFLPSAIEVFGNIGTDDKISFAGEGSQFAYYTGGTSIKRRKKKTDGVSYTWWTRSTSAYYGNCYMYVDSYGDRNSQAVGLEFAVSLTFAL